jgi:rhodanese-related sulfurtransferase
LGTNEEAAKKRVARGLGSGVRSVKACEKLTRLEFSKLYNLAGGFRAWAQAGKPVEK